MSAALLAFALAAGTQSVTEEDAVREFSTICVAHFFDLAGMKQAAAASPLGYVLEDAGTGYRARVWRSPDVAIDYYEGGLMSSQFPECKLTATLSGPASKRLLYGALARLPGSTRAAGSFGKQTWVVPEKGTIVAMIDAARPEHVVLTLQSILPIESKR